MAAKGAPLVDTRDERTGQVGAAEPRDSESRARVLVARELRQAAANRVSGRDEILAVVACERTYRELTRTLGRIGAHAILSRALSQAKLRHVLLESLRFDRDSEHTLVGIAATIQAHGATAVEAAIEALLQDAFVLLAKMVGSDMAARLLDSGGAMGIPEDEDST